MPRVKVHEFNLGDVEDPDLYAAEPIMAWQNTEAGQWVMQHSNDTVWQRNNDPMFWAIAMTSLRICLNKTLCFLH
jgi:hypothetical protein